MKKPVKRYVERMEALDLAAGVYQTRSLPRSRHSYNRTDFLDYLSAMELEMAELETLYDDYEEETG